MGGDGGRGVVEMAAVAGCWYRRRRTVVGLFSDGTSRPPMVSSAKRLQV